MKNAAGCIAIQNATGSVIGVKISKAMIPPVSWTLLYLLLNRY